MNVEIKKGGRMDKFTSTSKLKSIAFDLSDEKGSIDMEIFCDQDVRSLTYLDINEAIAIRDMLNDAIRQCAGV